MIVRFFLISTIAMFFLNCDLKSEFDVNPTDFFMQKKVRADQILGFTPSNTNDWHDFSMRGFLMGDEPYFAIKTNFAIEAVPGIYIVDKNLMLIKKLGQGELSYGGTVWNPSLSHWNIIGSIDASKLVLSFNSSPYGSGNSQIFELNKEFTAVNANVLATYRSMQRVAFELVDQSSTGFGIYAGVGTVSASASFGGFGGSNPFYVDQTGNITNYTNPPGSFSFLTTFEDGGNKYFIRIVSAVGNSSTITGLPVMARTITPAYTSPLILSSYAMSPYVPLNFDFDSERDGKLEEADRYIDELAMVSAGLIVPYPSGRDRLFDPLSGALVYIFDLNVQSDKDNGNSKGKYNHPRAYVSDAEIWFMYDQDTREFKRLVGWWL